MPLRAIDFAFLVAKYHIWVCRQKECSPMFFGFVRLLKNIREIEKGNKATSKKWKFFCYTFNWQNNLEPPIAAIAM